jgi:hypothetical protein
MSGDKKIESAEGGCSPQTSADAFDFWVEWRVCPRIEQNSRELNGSNLRTIPSLIRFLRVSGVGATLGFQRFQEIFFPVR